MSADLAARTVDFKAGERNVFFHLLTACNLSCQHCYINPPQHGTETLSTESVLKWLRLFARPEQQTNLILLGGEPVYLAPEEILVETQPAEGLAVAADKMVTVAVDSVITPDLRAEGLAREIVRRIQAQRKNADFNIEDRITTYYLAEGDLAGVFRDWSEYIKAETLTIELVAGESAPEAYTETHQVEGMEFTIGVQQVMI